MRASRLVIVLILLAAACSREATPDGAGTAGAAAEPVAASAPVACPAADFEGFLAAFAEDTALQRRWTTFPLESGALAEEGDEPTMDFDTFSVEQARFPLFPPAAQREAERREVEIADAAGGGKKVTLFRPDSDWTVDYHFAPREGCWRLGRIEDWSL